MAEPGVWPFPNFNVLHRFPDLEPRLRRALNAIFDATFIKLANTLYIAGTPTTPQIIVSGPAADVAIYVNTSNPTIVSGIVLGDTDVLIVGGSSTASDPYVKTSADKIELFQEQGLSLGLALYDDGVLYFADSVDPDITDITDNGKVWRDADQGVLAAHLNGANHWLPGVVFVQTDSVTHANSTTATSLKGTGIGGTFFPANYCKVGRILRLTAHGVLTADAGAVTLTVDIQFGGVQVGVTPAMAMPAGVTNVEWRVSVLILIRTVGATAVVQAYGVFELFHDTSAYSAHRTWPFGFAGGTVDTTAICGVDLTADWSVADPNNSITSLTMLLEQLA